MCHSKQHNMHNFYSNPITARQNDTTDYIRAGRTETDGAPRQSVAEIPLAECLDPCAEERPADKYMHISTIHRKSWDRKSERAMRRDKTNESIKWFRRNRNDEQRAARAGCRQRRPFFMDGTIPDAAQPDARTLLNLRIERKINK